MVSPSEVRHDSRGAIDDESEDADVDQECPGVTLKSPRSGIAGAQELNGVKGRFRVRDCADTGCRQGWVQGGHPGNPMT